MITKAGVPSNKVIVGVTSYGRSFQMVDPSCTGPNCLFTGGSGEGGSGAQKGRCTATSGYISNAEIAEIATAGLTRRDSDVRTWYDKESDSNMMTWGGDNWVSYMNEAVRASRTNKYKGLNMGGTTNWAVDLDKFHEPPKLIEDSDLTLDWDVMKRNIKRQGNALACDLELRTGTWVTKECTEDVAAHPSRWLPSERWEGLDCGSAWKDAQARWLTCDKPAGNLTFSQSVSQFFKMNEKSKCNDLAAVTNCDPDRECQAHHSGLDVKEDWTGAGAYLVWNALAQVHAVCSATFIPLLRTIF